MPHSGLTEGAALQLLSSHAAFVGLLLVAALFLFTRWLETGDRSAYAIGAFCGVVAPAWMLVVLGLLLSNDVFAFINDVPSDGWFIMGLSILIRLAGLALIVAILWATLRPLWVTGLFLTAPQGEVRRRWKKVETAWQFGIAFLVGAKVLGLLVSVAARWL